MVDFSIIRHVPSRGALKTRGGSWAVSTLGAKFAALVALIVPGAMPLEAATALPDVADLAAKCENSSGSVGANMRISACSQLLAAANMTALQRAKVLTNRAWAYGQNQLWTLAQQDYDAAIGLVPDWAIAHNDKAFAYLREGRIDLALRSYDRALQIEPKTIYALYGRGVARLRLKQIDAGTADLTAARSMMQNVDQVFALYGMAP